jgi:CheY-specific phosphatase CheX
MKRIAILVLVYIVGGVSGAVYHSVTAGAADRARIAALDSQIGERNEKLDKCTAALIESLHSTVTTQPEKAK